MRRILEALKQVAEGLGCSPAQAALAWVMRRPGVSSTLIGASKVTQLKDNLAALQVTLTNENIELLDRVSARTLGFTDSLASPEIRKMVYGGNQVRGWRE